MVVCVHDDDSMLVVYCLDDKMCCDGDGCGTHLAGSKCSDEAHHSHSSTGNVMMCTHTHTKAHHMDVVMDI